MTLNGVIAVILRCFTESDSFGGRLPIMSEEYPLPLLAKFHPLSSRKVYLR